MPKLTTVIANMAIECPVDRLDSLRKDLDHHIDYLVDMDSNRDRVESIYGVQSYVPGEPDHNRIKLSILTGLVRDILMTEPDDDSLKDSPELLEVYAELHNLKTALDNVPAK